MTGRERLDFVVRTLRAHADEFRARGVVHMAVFGSVARGEARADSDVDLVVDLDYSRRPTLVDVIDYRDMAGHVLGTEVDLVTRGAVDESLAADIRRDSVDVF